MTSRREDRLQSAGAWIAAYRLQLAVLAGVVWTGMMYLFIRDHAISVLCGLAFAAVLAATLPRPRPNEGARSCGGAGTTGRRRPSRNKVDLKKIEFSE